MPAAVGRHVLKAEAYDAGFHVGTSGLNAEAVQIRFFEPPGMEITAALRKEIEKHFTRLELRRAGAAEVGSVSYPTRVRESYVQDLLGTLDEAMAVRAALDSVGDPCREILDRFFCQDESYRTIGDVLEIPAGTVASRISRCLEKVRAELDGRSRGSRPS